MLQPLRERDFALFWLGWTVSLIGDGFFMVAIAWQVFNGNITGAGPKDPSLKRDYRASGLEPFSIRVGDVR